MVPNRTFQWQQRQTKEVSPTFRATNSRNKKVGNADEPLLIPPTGRTQHSLHSKQEQVAPGQHRPLHTKVLRPCCNRTHTTHHTHQTHHQRHSTTLAMAWYDNHATGNKTRLLMCKPPFQIHSQQISKPVHAAHPTPRCSRRSALPSTPTQSTVVPSTHKQAAAADQHIMYTGPCPPRYW